jgi:A/G-specific adenine glycosylase
MPQGNTAKRMPLRQFLSEPIRNFRVALLTWFELHKRDLPWRRTRDPYAIWISEIMLQQTRVAAVLAHYANWMARFPTVEALAAASEDEVLAAWSGLGYYRRARFLHKGAKVVVSGHDGKIPQTAAELRSLPGIGAYTSAAIASIAFGEVAAVVDGNVERVLLRQMGAAESGATHNGKSHPTFNTPEIQNLASLLIDPARPGDFNQAMMELGATVCLPRNPLCLQCPVQKSCLTRGEHPAAHPKPTANVDISFGLWRRQKNGAAQVLLEQRPASSTIMPQMWELPRLAADSTAAEPLLTLRHSIMQTNYRVSVVAGVPIAGAARPPGDAARHWIPVSELAKLPLTGLARKIFLRLGSLESP